MAAGAGMYVLGAPPEPSSVMFAAGAAAFASMQLRQTYDGRNTAIRRLRRIMDVGDVLFILSGVLMLENAFKFMLPLFVKYVDNGYMAYVTYIHNNWVVLFFCFKLHKFFFVHR